MSQASQQKRSGGRSNRKTLREAPSISGRMTQAADVHVGFGPLTDSDMQAIHQASLTLMARTGFSDATPRVLEIALANGCTLTEAGRLLIPQNVVEDCLAKAKTTVMLYGRDPKFDIELKNGTMNIATGGAAVHMLDMETRRFRPSTLRDLYDVARVIDTLENINYFGRTVVATDIADNYTQDVNLIYACASGTQKHFATAFCEGEHLRRSGAMLDMLAGGKEGDFGKRPFCTVHATNCVSPLSLAEDSTDITLEAIELGMPLLGGTGPQAGATSPAALAGTLALLGAESLFSVCLINMVRPGHPFIYGGWPFVADLRTGAFSGGGAEQTLLAAGAAQMVNFYGLPGGVGAGMTDSKQPDNQAGYEKGISLLASNLGAPGLVYESAGMLASIMACSLESLVIDNDMLSNVRRIAKGFEVNEETLSVDLIDQVAKGPGHFLGSAQTLELMETEYVYPEQADRTNIDTWTEAGSKDSWDRARDHVRQLLSQHRPTYISPEIDAQIRAAYPVTLDLA